MRSWVCGTVLSLLCCPTTEFLVGMTDPDSQKEPAAPPQPPRPAQVPIGPTSTAQSQVEADEQYARQLAEHYSGSSPYGGQPRSHSGTRRDPAIPRPQRDPAIPRPQRNTGLKPNELYDDRDHSFLDGMKFQAPTMTLILTSNRRPPSNQRQHPQRLPRNAIQGQQLGHEPQKANRRRRLRGIPNPSRTLFHKLPVPLSDPPIRQRASKWRPRPPQRRP